MKLTFGILLMLACAGDMMAQGFGYNVRHNPRRYRYSEFKEGKVAYGHGKLSNVHPFNYDRLYGQMLLIDEKGDTLTLGNERSFTYIIIGHDIFFHDYIRGYLEILDNVDSVQLAIREKQEITDYTDSDKSINEDIKLFLIAKTENVRVLNKSGILSSFSQRRKEIMSYIKTNKPDFRSRTDMQKLFAFCHGLYP